MITDQLNTGLISAMKEKLPQDTNLANLLMDILYIGKEAVYRRLRGEVPFTLAEAAGHLAENRHIARPDHRHNLQRQRTLRSEPDPL